VVIDELQWVL
jgi:hypothetical protein